MLFVFDPKSNEWIIQDAARSGAVLGTKRGLIRSEAFASKNKTGVAWSDTRALEALELLLLYAAPHGLTYGFRRPKDAIHAGESAHYAGLGFHIGCGLCEKEQIKIMRLALDVCGFDRVEPLAITPGWVHVEKRIAPPAGLSNGYPALQMGAKGVHVFVLQDMLNQYTRSEALTGCFSRETKRSVCAFQRMKKLPVSGAADKMTWQALMQSKSCDMQIK